MEIVTFPLKPLDPILPVNNRIHDYLTITTTPSDSDILLRISKEISFKDDNPNELPQITHCH